MNIDRIREYIVIVNGGSGCIFQPEDNAYSYVLTAKHNITDNNNQITDLTRFILEGSNFNEVSIPINALVENENYFPHPNRDIAILKTEKIPDLENIIRFDEISNDRTGYILAGYTEGRRKENPNVKADWFRPNENVTILHLKDKQLREAEVPNNAGQVEIDGCSGGGILKISDDYILLAGIQNKMVNAADEQMGRVEFSPISLFDEIISLYPNALSPINPPYCGSFEYLKEQVMKLEDCFLKDKIEYAKQYLQDFTDEIIKNPLTPKAIKNHLRERLLIHNEKESSLYNKGLWIAWLELLIILKIIGVNPQTEQELDEIFNQYRLFYSSSKKDWSSLIQDILRSNYKGLKENACIIVSNETKPRKLVIGKGIIQNIFRNIPKKQMNIDEGANRFLENLKYVHLYAFQQICIIEKEEEYLHFNNTNEEELLQKLKQEYEGIINNN